MFVDAFDHGLIVVTDQLKYYLIHEPRGHCENPGFILD